MGWWDESPTASSRGEQDTIPTATYLDRQDRPQGLSALSHHLTTTTIHSLIVADLPSIRSHVLADVLLRFLVIGTCVLLLHIPSHLLIGRILLSAICLCC